MLTLLPTPIGNIADITFRTIQTLENTQLILCEDTRVTKQLLNILKDRYNLELANVDIISFHEHNGKERLKQVATRLKKENVVYMSDAGMPVISDPGQLLVEYCQENSIEYDVLPGASVAPLIYAASGFKSGKFYFYGFLPQKGALRSQELRKIMQNGLDTIIYEAPHRILKLIEQICQIDEDREIFCTKELTKKYQKYYKKRAIELLDKLKNDSLKGEWALVIEAKKYNEATLNLLDIKELDIPPKAKAKLLAKLTNKSVKECYEELRTKR
jgi:16S rRNA (cytidine1402-2'-O)-methyltransferase